MFAQELYQQIKQVWESERIRCNAPIKECPDLEDLRAIVEAAFFASIKREEGKIIDFTLALITEQEVDSLPNIDAKHKYQIKMRFPDPLPLNVEVISKLADAFDKNSTALAVSSIKNDSSKTYQIWGALYFD